MPIYLDVEPAERTRVPRASEPIAQSVSARGVHRGRQSFIGRALDAARAFFQSFDRRVENQRVLDRAPLVHGADGVLRVPATSPKKRSETLREGPRR